MLVLILVCSVGFGKDSHQIRFDGKVLVIDSNIKIVIDDRRGRKEPKHKKTTAKEQLKRSKEQPSNITAQQQLYCYTVSYLLYGIQVGVEWRGILNS